jgi:glycosyltransferase involved in cell wall biosynthesis
VSYLQEPYRPFYEASPKLPWLLSAASTAHPRNPYKRAMERSRDLHLLHAIRLQAREELSWAQKFNRILCNSQFSRESILRAYNIDPKVCYLGIDSEAFSPVSSKKEGYVIGAGSIHPSKNIAAAIMAIGKIPTRNRPPLLWIGNLADDSYKQQLMSIADRNEVEFKCKTLVSDSELQLAMSKAACFLYTSHLEPFGLTPLEANACGTAVVAVGEGGVRETIIQEVNGFLTLDNNPNELGDLVCRFTENLEYAKEMGRQARHHVIKHWPVSKANDRLEQHLISITN